MTSWEVGNYHQPAPHPDAAPHPDSAPHPHPAPGYLCSLLLFDCAKKEMRDMEAFMTWHSVLRMLWSGCWLSFIVGGG